jgi:F0F1-type ATP synthase assembly protein I
MCNAREECDKIANAGDWSMVVIVIAGMLAASFVGMKATTPVELPARDVHTYPEECRDADMSEE